MRLFRKPKYSTVRATPKKSIPPGLWVKCKGCGSVVYRSTLEQGLYQCPKCKYLYPLQARKRIDMLTDEDSFQEADAGLASVDVLDFGGDGGYARKIEESTKKTGLRDAVVCGTARIDNRHLALGVMDFRFCGASMGSVVGEKVTRLAEFATRERLPLVMVTASGGARMQDGMLSLMQMAKTSGALAIHANAGLPYIVVMTNPTTAGVTASFASLGDVILAEPGALIGFAGRRVIEQTIKQELPDDFQTAEFLLAHGFIDMIVERKNLRRTLARLVHYLQPTGAVA